MPHPKRIVIAGGSGFIGQALARRLAARGDEVVILSRDPRRTLPPLRGVHWDGRTLADWAGAVNGADAVINLAGRNVNCRYTPRALREIDQSRVDAVRVMAQAIGAAATKPTALIQASTTAIYGHTFEHWCDETQPPGWDTPGSAVPVATATQWEEAFERFTTCGPRRVLLRISFALGPDGGALRTLANLTRCFLGGAAGSGRQYISWIHNDDLCRVFEEAIDSGASAPPMEGVYNVTAPNPVTNANFMHELRRVLCRPWSPPTPALLVRLGCLLMRTEPVLALTGRRVQPRRLHERGFVFQHPTLPEALTSILG